MITAQELREKYIKFFEEKGHKVIPSASLIPENDPSVLFTTAGMHPLVPYLLSEKHPAGKKLVDIQKCIRTSDINEVGDNWHVTFLEMLGNWSLGDYFKKEAIEWSWEFLTDKKWLDLDPQKLAVSIFAGDKDAPFDDEAYNIWRSLGVSEVRIAKLPKEDNWWGPAGETGPCGPDSEMFYWSGKEEAPNNFDPKDKRWVEVWNDVFMQYNKTIEGKYEPLKQKNIDTGMGLERIVAVKNGKQSVYESELFTPIIDKIIEIAGAKNSKEEFMASNERAIRIIADHLRAATFILGDEKGIVPLNVGQGYILRRLIRRAVRYGKMIGIERGFTSEIARVVIDLYKDVYPEVKKNKEFILNQLNIEEEKFQKTISKGLKEFFKLKKIDGEIAFDLYQTYGFPIELTQELAQEKGFIVDKKIFEQEFRKHQELSRTTSAGMFKGGLADASEQTTKYHTATHLLLAALREILSPEIYQKGSNITADRLRFDFNYPQKTTAEQIKKIEDLINKKIKEKIPVEMVEIPKDKAIKIAKVSFDPAKYGDIVKVYKIDDFSVELCGGPHAKNTSELGKFKIIKEEASSAGVRRIKAVLE